MSRRSNFDYRSVQQTGNGISSSSNNNNGMLTSMSMMNACNHHHHTTTNNNNTGILNGTNNLILSATKSDCSSLVIDDDMHGSAWPMDSNGIGHDAASLGMRHHNMALLNPNQQQYNNYVTYAFVFHQTLVDLLRIFYCLFYANNMYFEYKRYIFVSCFFFIFLLIYLQNSTGLNLLGLVLGHRELNFCLIIL